MVSLGVMLTRGNSLELPAKPGESEILFERPRKPLAPSSPDRRKPLSSDASAVMSELFRLSIELLHELGSSLSRVESLLATLFLFFFFPTEPKSQLGPSSGPQPRLSRNESLGFSKSSKLMFVGGGCEGRGGLGAAKGVSTRDMLDDESSLFLYLLERSRILIAGDLAGLQVLSKFGERLAENPRRFGDRLEVDNPRLSGA